MTKTLRVSATDIEALRWYLADDDADLGDLLAQLRRQTAPTEAMMAGTAFHSAIEKASAGEVKTLEAEGYEFDLRVDAEIDLPSIRETKATKVFAFPGVAVTLVGKVDAIHGKRVDDHKLTGRYDPERFLGSFQWRAYLSIFEADEFRYNIFEASPVEWTKIGDGVKRYAVRAFHRLTVCRYPDLEKDVERAVRQFLAFAEVHLPERIIPAEEAA